MREFDIYLDLERKLSFYFVLALLATFLAPFRTQELTFWARLTFFSLDIAGVGLFMHVIVATLFHSRHVADLHPFLRLAIGSALAGLPSGAWVSFLFVALRGLESFPGSFPILWLEISVTGVLVLYIEFALWPIGRPPPRRDRTGTERPTGPESPPPQPPPHPPLAPGQVPPGPPRPRLLERLSDIPPGAEVISLSMQDHYVEVTTTAGQALILMRLSDAIDLLDGLPGARIHRSHWAARPHARSLRRTGRRHDLLLSDGRTLPVSASHREAAAALVDEGRRG